MCASSGESAVPLALLPTAVARPHLDFLDGLRALAALFVVLHHMFIQIWNIFRHEYPAGHLFPLIKWIIYGHFAVSLFIVLSGFCLMLPVVRGSGTLPGGVRTFFRKRARRILPTYYCAIGFSLLLDFLGQRCAHVSPVRFPVTAQDLLLHLLLLHNLSQLTISGINGAFWSIAVECQIYLLFPLLIGGWQRVGGLLTTLIAIIAAYAAYFAVRDTALRGLTAHYLALFALGMLGAQIAFSSTAPWTKLREQFPWNRMLLVTFSLLVWLCIRWDWEIALGSRVYQTDFLFGCCALLLLVAATRPGVNRLRALLSTRYLVFTGGFAYSIYLVHLPIVLLLWRFLLQPLHLPASIAYAMFVSLGLPLVLVAAYCFHLGCERPFLNTRRLGAAPKPDAPLP